MTSHIAPGRKKLLGLAAPIVRLAALATAWCGAAAPRPAAAEVVLYQTGFEASQGFLAGRPLVGQGGFVARLGLNPDAAMVVAEDHATGSQAVQVDGALLTSTNPSGLYGAGYYPVLNYDYAAHGTPIITESVDVQLVVKNDVTPDIEAGLTAYDPQGRGLGGALYGGPGATAGVYGYDNLRLVFDYTTMTGTSYVDGTLTGSGPIGSTTLFNPAIFAYGADAPPADLVAYFDNFTVTASAVPEPGPLALAGVAVAGALAWRLRRAS